jgi:hypothetical protein
MFISGFSSVFRLNFRKIIDLSAPAEIRFISESYGFCVGSVVELNITEVIEEVCSSNTFTGW